MAAELHVGDVGTRLIATIYDGTEVKNVSTATVKELTIRKPDGTTITVDALFLTDGVDGNIYYATTADTFSDAGYYKIQGFIMIGANSWNSDIYTVRVHPNL
jgi:hypothetical protein